MDMEEGEEIVMSVLARVRSLLENMEGKEEKTSKETLQEGLEEVREEVLGSGNAYIQAILMTPATSTPTHYLS